MISGLPTPSGGGTMDFQSSSFLVLDTTPGLIGTTLAGSGSSATPSSFIRRLHASVLCGLLLPPQNAAAYRLIGSPPLGSDTSPKSHHLPVSMLIDRLS